MSSTKAFDIPKTLVWNAYLDVKRSAGGPGVDGQSMEELESDLKNNLYKIWNRMSSGSYFPPPVLLVEIPKAAGGVRPLGIPTVIPYCTSYSDLYECYPTMCFNLSETLILSLRSFSFSEFRVIQ